MRKYFLAIAVIISCNFSFACGNEYFRADMPLEKGNLNTKFLLEYDYAHDAAALPYWTHGFTDGGIKIDPTTLLEQYNKTKDYKYLSDYAWELVKQGKAKQAVIILDSLLKTHPNEYNILANLGTAYEIVGNNKMAHELLTKAVATNKNSHYGSEWIHLNILKHKIDKEAFPLEKIIDIGSEPFNTDWNSTVLKYNMSTDSILKSIAYQLHERIGFIAPKDKIIGRLIFDFAEIISKTKSKEEAIPFYDYAMYYDNDLYYSVVQSKKAIPLVTTTTIIENPSNRIDYKVVLAFGSIILAVIAFIVGRKTANKK
jgi:tetratricopeptide (TPR) repeat protein